MEDPQLQSDFWRFGLFERMLLVTLLLSMGAVQITFQEAVLREHGTVSSAALNELTSTLMLGLLVYVALLAFGGPLVRAGVAKIVPRAREAIGV